MVELVDCIGDYSNFARIGIEIEKDGGISLYFPLMKHHAYKGVNTSIYFSQKEAATMYLAMLESPILDSSGEVKNRLEHQKRST